MKRICFLISLVFLALPGPLSLARGKSLELYYIAHDHYETKISSILEKVRADARNNPERTVLFYLADGHKSQFFRVSPDDEDAWIAFYDELVSRTAHPVTPLTDRDAIMDLLTGEDILGDKGFDAFDRVALNFYITPGFVSMDYGDTLIGGLYWNMDLANLSPDKLQINVFHAPAVKVSPDRLFGRKRLTGNFPVRISPF